MLIFQVISSSFFASSTYFKKYKPECQIETYCICHDHTTLGKNLIFWKENIDIILSTVGVPSIVYISIFLYTDQTFRNPGRVEHHDPRAV